MWTLISNEIYEAIIWRFNGNRMEEGRTKRFIRVNSPYTNEGCIWTMVTGKHITPN